MIAGLVAGLLASLLAGPTLEPPPEAVANPGPDASAARVSPRPGRIALTFDDGPHPRWTPIVLDVLDEYGVAATFFVNGFRVDAYPELTAEIVARGHSLQNHGYGHARLDLLSDAGVAAEIGLGAEAIARATGVVTDCLRPAYGIVGPRINGLVLGSGHAVVMWDRDSGDWDHQSARAAVGRVIGSMKAGDVILMHDSVGWVARDALPLIIEEALRRGLGFDTLCDDRPPQRAGERSLTWSNALGLRA